MKTILHIDNTLGVTGAYKALFSFCKSYDKARHILVMPKGSQVVPEVKEHFTVYELPFVEIGRAFSKMVRYIPALLLIGQALSAIIAREKPDLIHVNDLYNLTPYFIKSKYRKTIPLLVHARLLKRGFPSFIYDFWVRTHLKRANEVLAVSQAIRKDWGNHSKVEVVYNPISIRENYPRYSFTDNGQGVFRFIYLANYMYEKGQHDCLKAIVELKKLTNRPFIVDFFGATFGLHRNEHCKQHLKTLVKELGLMDCVTINDSVSDIEQKLKEYHCSLHFSHAESFGMGCFESLFYGLPVISTHCGGPDEMIEDQYSGLMVSVLDIKAQASAMNLLMSDPELCLSISENAYKSIRQKFGGISNKLFQKFDKHLGI